MEPRGDQEFLEADVTVAGNQLALSLNNKVIADILSRLPPYRQRLPPKMPRAANRTVLGGILIRILQSTSDNKLITMCILGLRYEAQHYHLEDYLVPIQASDSPSPTPSTRKRRNGCRGGTGKS